MERSTDPMHISGRYQMVIELLDQIMESSLPADSLMTQAFRHKRYIGASDRRFICDITYGLLRDYYRLKWMCQVSALPVNGRSFLLADLGKNLSLIQVNEIFSGDEYAPSVLTPSEHKKIQQLKDIGTLIQPDYVKLNAPEWVIPQLADVFGPALTSELQALNEAATLDLRVNSLKTTRPYVLELLKKEGVSAASTPYSPLGIRLGNRRPLGDNDLWKKGFIEVQDEGSQIIGLLASAQPGMSVMDFCAGAGGKTLTMAATMMNKGRLVACDVSEWRLNRARDRLRRSSVHNVEVRLLDESASKWLKRQAGKFDRVLLDVPCSGTGTWRRNPDLKWRLTAQGLQEVCEKQHFILTQAASLVKPGGWLIYATCSVLKTENEDQIHKFLDLNKAFEALPLSTVWGQIMESPYPLFESEPNSEPFLRLTPHRHKTDGFFAAILRRMVNDK